MHDKNKATGNDPNNVFIEGTYLLHVLSYIEVSILGVSGIYPLKQNGSETETDHQCTLCQKHFFWGTVHTQDQALVCKSAHIHTPSSPLCRVAVCKDLCSLQCLSHRHKRY